MNHKLLNVFGTLLYALNQWIQIILITRILGLYDVGLFSFFLATLAPIIMFSRFSFSFILPTQTQYNYSFNLFYKYRRIFNYIFFITIIILIISFDLNIYEKVCFLLFTAFKYIENKQEFVYAVNISRSRINVLANSKMFKSFLSIILFSLTIYISNSLLLSILSLVLSQLIVYILYDRKKLLIDSYDNEKLTLKKFENIFKLGIGLSIVAIISSLIANIPRYFLEYYDGLESLGIYATIVYFATLINYVVITINQSFISDFSKIARRSIKEFYKSISKLTFIYTIIVVISFLITLEYGTNILAIVYGEYFIDYQLEVTLVGIQIIFMVYFKLFEMCMNILNIYNIQVYLQMIALIITILLSFVFINLYGIIGAFLTVIACYIILVLTQVIVLFYYTRNNKIKIKNESEST